MSRVGDVMDYDLNSMDGEDSLVQYSSSSSSLSLARYGVPGDASSLSVPLCRTCSFDLTSVDTFCAFCGYGCHANEACAVKLRGGLLAAEGDGRGLEGGDGAT